MGREIPGYRRINGSWGEVWVDGELWAEITKFEASYEISREDVHSAGSIGADSKMVGTSGKISITLEKVYSRINKKVAMSLKQGKDIRLNIIGKLDDPDSYGAERIAFNDCWVEKLNIMNFELTKKIEEPYELGYNPDKIEYLDEIVGEM